MSRNSWIFLAVTVILMTLGAFVAGYNAGGDAEFSSRREQADKLDSTYKQLGFQAEAILELQASVRAINDKLRHHGTTGAEE